MARRLQVRLRGLIAEKLSVVTAEILAAVEETVTEYEAEATGFRRESEPLLHHPRVKVEPAAEFENTQGLEILSVSGALSDDQLLGLNGSEAASSPRLTPLAVRLKGSHMGSLENYLDLRICVLSDWTVEQLSDQVREAYPVHELQCRSDLQEAALLMLLRSTFPQLAPAAPFDPLVADGGGRLRPLRAESFTPKQICRAAGNAALYLRLKRPTEHEAGSEQQPMQTSDDKADLGDWFDEEAPPTLSPADGRSDPQKEKPPPTQQVSNDGPIVLSFRLLDDPRISYLSKSVLKRYKQKKVVLPRGLQEAEFLPLLSSAFPQLANGRPFDLLMTDNTKRLFPLNADALTPEKLRAAAGNSGIYIRLKRVDRNVQARPKSASAGDRPSSDPKNNNGPGQADGHINLRIHVLEDADIEVVSSEVLRKYRLNKLQCRRGMTEAEFLQQLHSTFPQLRHFQTFTCDRGGKLLPLRLGSLTPETVCSAAGTSALYLRLKHPEESEYTVLKRQLKHLEAAPATPPPTAARNASPHGNHGDENGLTLWMCYVEDASADLLSRDGADAFSTNPRLFFKKFPICEVRCPRRLQQQDFLRFLRNVFPGLDDARPLSVLALHSRKAELLELSRLLPEEIWRRTSGMRTPVICLQQLKKPPQREDAEPKELPTVTPPAAPTTSSQAPVQPPVQPPAGPSNREPDNLVDLKICIVNDPSADASSPLVLQEHPIVEFQCPSGLKEAEFLHLLRSTFPQLAAGALTFLAGNDVNMKPINLENLTSDEISRNLKQMGYSILCIQIKEPRDVPAGVKRSRCDVSDPGRNSQSKRVKKRRKRPKVESIKSPSHPRNSDNDETEDSEDEDELKNIKSTKLLGLQSLISKYNAGSGHAKTTDEKPSGASASIQVDDDPTDDSEDESYKTAQFSRLSFLQLQKPQEKQQAEETVVKQPPPAVKQPPPAVNQAPPAVNQPPPAVNQPPPAVNQPPPAVNQPPPAMEVKEVSQVEDEETEDSEDYDDDNESQKSSVTHKFSIQPPKVPGQNDLHHSDGQKPSNRKVLQCALCQAKHWTRRMLIRHAWKHLDHPDRLCVVCMKTFDSEDSLKDHLQTHQKTYRCKICGKSFLSQSGFDAHVERHKVSEPDQK